MVIKQLIIIQLLVTSLLTGLVWVVQLVHYPGFRYVDQTQFIDFQYHHMRSILYIVGPLMLIELALALWLQVEFWGKSGIYSVSAATVLLIVIWLVTFLVSSPIHGQLATQGYDEKLITKLVNTNWIRTVAWSVRTGIFVFILLRL
ncbi:MAG: hypothetical protein AAGE93_02580 [Bacteroidota bacterium]